MRRLFVKISAFVLTALFSTWGVGKVMLDALGRVDVVRGLATDEGVGHKLLWWLFSTPWYVPAILAACMVVLWAAIAHRTIAPASIDDKRRREAQDRPYFSIQKVIFDPSGPTEMYVEIILSNPGPPTTIHNWKLQIYLPNSKSSIELVPRWHTAGRPMPQLNSWDAHFNDLSVRPIESGIGHLRSRIGFTVAGVAAAQQFGAIGARFHLSAEDVRGNVLSDTYVLQEILSA